MVRIIISLPTLLTPLIFGTVRKPLPVPESVEADE